MLKFEADDKIFKLVIKVHRFNYQDIVTASGVFDGHILNLRFVGDYEQVYRIMQGYEKTTSATLPTQPIEELTAEEAAAAIGEATK